MGNREKLAGYQPVGNQPRKIRSYMTRVKVLGLASARKTDDNQHVQKFFRGFMQYKVLLCDDLEIFGERSGDSSKSSN